MAVSGGRIGLSRTDHLSMAVPAPCVATNLVRGRTGHKEKAVARFGWSTSMSRESLNWGTYRPHLSTLGFEPGAFSFYLWSFGFGLTPIRFMDTVAAVEIFAEDGLRRNRANRLLSRLVGKLD